MRIVESDNQPRVWLKRESLETPYIAMVVAVAAAVALLAVTVAPDRPADGKAWFMTIVLGVMVAVARRFPIDLGAHARTVVDTAAVFAAVLLLPVPLAIGAVTLGLAAGEAASGLDPPQFAFNVGETMLEVSAAVLVYNALEPDAFGTGPAAELNVSAITLAAMIIYFLNVVLVDTMIAIWSGFGSIRWSIVQHRADFPQQACLYLIGLVMAVVGYQYSLMLPLLGIPAYVVYVSLRNGVHLQVKARETLESVADIVDFRDHYTYEHSTRVAEMAREMAIEMGLEPEEISTVYLGARIHDVGKIGIRSTVLMKEGPLDDDEWREMRTHPEVGAALVTKFPDYRQAGELVLSHHERFDGKGYPRGLKGQEIAIGARIISVADTFDAMTSKRSYRDALAVARAVEEIKRNSGTQFDPDCVEIFLALLEKRGLNPVPRRQIVLPTTAAA